MISGSAELVPERGVLTITACESGVLWRNDENILQIPNKRNQLGRCRFRDGGPARSPALLRTGGPGPRAGGAQEFDQALATVREQLKTKRDDAFLYYLLAEIQ